ncbi:MAG: hypothetical protein ACYC9O_19940, partial [Candidatus Latescibacterota bacterium]
RHISQVGKLQQGRNVVSFNTEIEIIDKDHRLKPGMSCDVDVILAQEDDVIFVPLEAVYQKKEGDEDDENRKTKNLIFVQVEKDSTAVTKKNGLLGMFAKKPNPLDDFEEVEVEVGLRNDSRIAISAALDTSKVLAADAEKIFKDKEAEKNKKKKGKPEVTKQAEKN